MAKQECYGVCCCQHKIIVCLYKHKIQLVLTTATTLQNILHVSSKQIRK